MSCRKLCSDDEEGKHLCKFWDVRGDPLMPGLYSLAALPARRGGLCLLPERVRELCAAVEEALRGHAHVQPNRAKTRIWNAVG